MSTANNSVLITTATLLIGVFSFAVSSAWNSAFQKYFSETINETNKTYGPWIYAFVITVIAIAIVYNLNIVKEEEEQKKQNGDNKSY